MKVGRESSAFEAVSFNEVEKKLLVGMAYFNESEEMWVDAVVFISRVGESQRIQVIF